MVEKTDLERDVERQYGILRHIDYSVLVDFCIKELDNRYISEIVNARLKI